MAPIRRIMRFFIAVSIAGCIATIMVAHWITPIVPGQRLIANVVDPPIRSRGFLVDTPSCHIPDLDPFDSSIAKLIRRRGKILCYGKPSITYEEGHMLKINWTAVLEYYDSDLKYCKYQSITRGQNYSDFEFSYSDFDKPFNQTAVMFDEFVRVYCISKSEGTINTNFHSLIIPKKSVEQRCNKNFNRHLQKNKPKEVLNVLMIGVDSVSRLNFIRQMPRTRKYLLDNLKAIEMLGYTKVADNTFVNIVPMTTGKFVEELPWNETMRGQTFDKYNFIWNNFSNNGYRTLYAEDAPKIAIFTFLKNGFRKSPADHYNRAFSIALEKHKSVWNHDHHCVGDRLESDIVLKYVSDFTTLYRDKPHFGFAFITRLTHDDMNDAGAADDPHFRFLKKMKKEELLKNTVLIYFSDHGNRYGDIRKTFVGKLEERLPFLFFVFPKWFRKKYPKLVTNMKLNSNRLSTPFDVYETLKHILYFKGQVKMQTKKQKGVSLFHEISRDRTCEQSWILPHWCVCLNRVKLPISSKYSLTVAEYIVKHINEQLFYHRNLCETLSVQEIKESVLMLANKNVLHFLESIHDVINRTVFYGNRTDAVRLYQLTFVSTPGNGLFEGTVGFEESTGSYFLAGDISRINRGSFSDLFKRWHIRNVDISDVIVHVLY